MNDITDRLRELNGEPPTVAADADVHADLARGRSALRQRRMRWTTAGVTACVAAVAVTGVIVGTSGGPTGGATSPGAQSSRHTQHVQHGAIRLVSYTGEQQPGFTVTTVPEGYVLQGAQPSSLDIAPADDHSSLDVFSGKLVVMLQSIDVKPDESGTPVTVNGNAGHIRHDDGATTLEYTDGTHDIVVQSWNNIHLTDDQLVQFADGVTVTAAAQAGRG